MLVYTNKNLSYMSLHDPPLVGPALSYNKSLCGREAAIIGRGAACGKSKRDPSKVGHASLLYLKRLSLLAHYVDNLILIGSANGLIAQIKVQMKQEFDMQEFGHLSPLLGIEV